MKVAFVLGTSTGGTGRHVAMLAAGCAAQGLRVEVFGPAQTNRDFGFSTTPALALPSAPAPPSDPAPTSASALTSAPAVVPAAGFTAVDIADRPRVVRDLRAILRLRRLLRAWRPDVVHAHGLRAGALTAIAVVLVRPTVYAARPALIVTVHNAPAAGGVTGAIYRVLERIVARRADSVLCVSPDLQARMRAAGARRVGHAPVPALTPLTSDAPAAAADPARPASNVSAETPAVSAETPAVFDADPDRPLVLAVGRLALQKGFGTLIEAASRWRDIKPEPVLMIAGEGPLEAELKHQAAALGIDARFVGQRDDVPALLAAAAVFVLPSVWEGQPLILQEALRAGAAIVATRVGGTPELTGEDAALLVPSGDPGRLADAVRVVLTDPGLAARLRQAAAARARALPDEVDAVTAALAEYDRATQR